MDDSFTFDAASAKRISDTVHTVEAAGNRSTGDLTHHRAQTGDVWPLLLTGTNDASGNPLPLGQYLATFYNSSATTNTATGISNLCQAGLTNVVFIDMSQVFDTSAGSIATAMGKLIGFTGDITSDTNATALCMGLTYNPFDLFTLNADWSFGQTTISGTIPRNTNTLTVDLVWPWTSGTNEAQVPYCGLVSGASTLVMRYPPSIPAVNYGLAVGWSQMSPLEGCQPDMTQPLTPVCNDDGTVSFTTTNYVRVVFSVDPASCP